MKQLILNWICKLVLYFYFINIILLGGDFISTCNLYKEVCSHLLKYKDDYIFKKEFPDIEVIVMLIDFIEKSGVEKDRSILNYIESKYSNILERICLFCNMFESKRTDIEWFYESKDRQFKNIMRKGFDDIIRYECYDGLWDYDDIDIFCDKCVELFNKIQQGSYLDAYLNVKNSSLYKDEIISVRRNLNNVDFFIKDVMIHLYYELFDIYGRYENKTTKNRNINKEIEDIIKVLQKNSENETFRKQVPNIEYILSDLERAKYDYSKERYDAYKAFSLIADIREFINFDIYNID